MNTTYSRSLETFTSRHMHAERDYRNCFAVERETLRESIVSNQAKVMCRFTLLCVLCVHRHPRNGNYGSGMYSSPEEKRNSV